MHQDDQAALGPTAFGGQHRNSMDGGEFQSKNRRLKPTSKSHVPNGKDPNQMLLSECNIDNNK